MKHQLAGHTVKSSTLAIRISLIAVGLGAVAAGCTAAGSPRAVEVFVESTCPSVAPSLTSHAAPLAIAGEMVLSAAIGSALDAAGAYLTSAATTKSVALKGSANDHFYQMSPNGVLSLKRASGCLVVVARGSEPIRPWFANARDRASILRGYDRLPQLYFEAAFDRPADTAQALLVRPQFLHISSFQESSGWSHKDTRNYSIAVTLRNLEDGQPFGAISFSFDDKVPGTWAPTRVIKTRLGGSDEDATIQPSLNGEVMAQRVSWMPVGPATDSAAKAQALLAAPFLKAAKIANRDVVVNPPEPVPEWVVRSEPVGGKEESAFIVRLNAFCASLDKLKKPADQPRDARCPTMHLQAVNDLEEARAKLQAALDEKWANEFIKIHSLQCKTNAAGKTSCLPTLATPLFGSYSWEVTFVETREPTAFSVALASAYATNKDKLKSELENELLPSKRQSSRETVESAKRDALNQYHLSILKVSEAQAKLDEAAMQPRSVQVALQSELLRAKIAANAAARAAKQAEPFPL